MLSCNAQPRLTRAGKLEQRILYAVNRERAAAGAPALEWEPRLAEVAFRHSSRMVEAGFFSHRDPRYGEPAGRLTRAGIRWRSSGENIHKSKGHADPVRIALSDWMKSSGHRRNILDAGFTHTGVGVATGPGGLYTITQVFVRY